MKTRMYWSGKKWIFGPFFSSHTLPHNFAYNKLTLFQKSNKKVLNWSKFNQFNFTNWRWSIEWRKKIKKDKMNRIFCTFVVILCYTSAIMCEVISDNIESDVQGKVNLSRIRNKFTLREDIEIKFLNNLFWKSNVILCQIHERNFLKNVMYILHCFKWSFIMCQILVLLVHCNALKWSNKTDAKMN